MSIEDFKQHLDNDDTLGAILSLNTLHQDYKDSRRSSLYGNTLLTYATKAENLPVVQALIADGVNIDGRGEQEWTALHISSGLNNIELTELLIKSGADLNARDTKKNTPLHLAVIQGSVDVMEVLIKSGADINAQNDHGFTWTPLHHALNFRQYPMIKMLMNNGADLDVPDSTGRTPRYMLSHLPQK